jgi:hypothetical protein
MPQACLSGNPPACRRLFLWPGSCLGLDSAICPTTSTAPDFKIGRAAHPFSQAADLAAECQGREGSKVMAGTRLSLEQTPKRDLAAEQLYEAGMEYIAALQAWIESTEGLSIRPGDVAHSRYRLAVTEHFLIKLFADRPENPKQER